MLYSFQHLAGAESFRRALIAGGMPASRVHVLPTCDGAGVWVHPVAGSAPAPTVCRFALGSLVAVEVTRCN